MPKADGDGNLSYSRTIPASALPKGTIEQIKDLHIVQHGIDVERQRQVRPRGPRRVVFAKSLGVSGIPEEATNPATCGMVMGAAAGSTPAGGVETGRAAPRAPSRSRSSGWPALALAGAPSPAGAPGAPDHHARDHAVLATSAEGI
jgi:hypothetical protein